MPIIFRRIGGRIIPIKQIVKNVVQDERTTLIEVKRARLALKTTGLDRLGQAFLSTARERAKVAGTNIGKRIARFKKKGIL